MSKYQVYTDFKVYLKEIGTNINLTDVSLGFK